MLEQVHIFLNVIRIRVLFLKGMSCLLVLHQFGVDFGKCYSHRPDKMRQRGCRFGLGALGGLFSRVLKSVDSLVYLASPFGGLSRYLTHCVQHWAHDEVLQTETYSSVRISVTHGSIISGVSEGWKWAWPHRRPS